MYSWTVTIQVAPNGFSVLRRKSIGFLSFSSFNWLHTCFEYHFWNLPHKNSCDSLVDTYIKVLQTISAITAVAGIKTTLMLLLSKVVRNSVVHWLFFFFQNYCENFTKESLNCWIELEQDSQKTASALVSYFAHTVRLSILHCRLITPMVISISNIPTTWKVYPWDTATCFVTEEVGSHHS